MSAIATPDPAAPAGRPWTPEQRTAVARRTGDLLLDAGAGSGKTSVLVERYVRSVLDDQVDVMAILTITFTEKAAAELRDRIRTRLRELGAGEQARRTEGAFISTIHGFCARMLRAHALAAGLDPHFTVLDGLRAGALSDVAFDQALAELGRGHAGLLDLIAAYGAGTLRSAVRAVHAQLRSAGDEAPRLPPAPPPGDDAWVELERAALAVSAELAQAQSPGPRVLDAIARVDRCLQLTGEVWPPELEALRLPGNGSALSTDACMRYAEALTRFRAQCAARAALPVRDLLDDLLSAYGRRYTAAKRAVAGLDFEDLELIARRLLRDDDELREQYAQRFERIMVDELQDTNRVQLELIESLARDNLFTVGDAQQSIYGFRHADVQLFAGRGRRLAAVGARETLQTNFRSAPELLAAVNVGFANELGERFTPLRPGRRDSPAPEPPVELLLVDKGADWELEGVASPWRLAEARLLADRLAGLVADGAAPGEIVVLLRATTDMRAYERALEQRGLPTYVIGGRGYWSHPQVVDLVAYLKALANPLDEPALYGLLASPMVGLSLDALVLLAAAARAAGRDPWTVVCDGGLVGSGADVSVGPGAGMPAGRGGGVLSGSGAHADASGRGRPVLDGADRERLTGFAAWFAAERRRAPRLGLEQLIESALVASGYDLEILALPGGRRRLANVRKLMRLAREHEHAHGPDLRGFLDAIDERSQPTGGPEARESEAPVEGEGLDAIRLMTIHRAKGLEFPVVAVADLGRSVVPGHDILRVGSDGRIGIRVARAGAGRRESAFDYKQLGDEQRQAQDQEERRLFYVAMTRARERLILSGALKFDGLTGGGPAAWIAPAFVPELGHVLADGGGEVQLGDARLTVRVGRPEDRCGPDEGSPEAPSRPDAPVAAAAAVPAVATGRSPDVPPAAPAAGAPVATLSYSSLNEYARCGYRFYAERVLGLPAAPEPFTPLTGDIKQSQPAAGGPRNAVDRGILLHAMLERLDFRRPGRVDTGAIAPAAARAGVWPVPGPAEADELAAVVRRFAGSDLCARLGRATDTRREQRFAFPAADGLLVVGALDVLAREPGGRLLIVDYKSDRLAGASPAAVAESQYRTQRLVYALAGLHAGARTVEIAHCFLELPEQPVVVVLEQADLAGLEAQLQALTRGIIERRFAVAPAPHRGLCSGCPAEGGLCSWPRELTRRESPDRLF